MKVLASGLDDATVMFLRENGILVEPQEVADAEDLQSWLVEGEYDAGVLDLETSNLGIYAARGLRAKKIAAPIIGISRDSGEKKWGDHRAMFLENGGDDLLRGPANPRELVASLRAVTRRAKGALLDIFELQSGGAKLKVNLTTRTVTINGDDLGLTDRELKMMLLFASSPGRVLSKEMLVTQMYTGGVDDEPDIKIIDVFLCKLRHKLKDMHPDAQEFLVTVWGRGYRLRDQAELTKMEAQPASAVA